MAKLPLTNKGVKKPKAPTKKELLKTLCDIDADFIGTDIDRVRISTFKLIIEKLT